MAKFTKDEVAQHCDENSLWMVLNDKVYDVTKFMVEHPGGEDVLLQWAGQDATEAFNDVGHSEDAKTMAKDYLIGELAAVEEEPDAGIALPEEAKREGVKDSWAQILTSSTWTNFLIPVALSIGVFCIYKMGTVLFNKTTIY